MKTVRYQKSQCDQLFSHKIDSKFAIVRIKFVVKTLMVNIRYRMAIIIVQWPYTYIIDSSNISRFFFSFHYEYMRNSEKKQFKCYWNFSIMISEWNDVRIVHVQCWTVRRITTTPPPIAQSDMKIIFMHLFIIFFLLVFFPHYFLINRIFQYFENSIFYSRKIFQFEISFSCNVLNANGFSFVSLFFLFCS